MKLLPTLLLAALPCAALLQEPKPTVPPMDGPRAVIGQAGAPFRVNDHLGRLAAPIAAPVAGGVLGNERWTVLAFYPKAATPG